jgi:hypothetical protein
MLALRSIEELPSDCLLYVPGPERLAVDRLNQKGPHSRDPQAQPAKWFRNEMTSPARGMLRCPPFSGDSV